DVLLSDIAMPGLDGYALLGQARARLQGAQLPAAALTAYAGATDRTRALAAGFQAHLAKPVDPAELVAVVAQLAYATREPLTGGDLQTAETVWVTSMGGTYVVTPGMLQGEEPIVFTGTPSGTNATADTRSVEERPLGGS